MKPINKRGIELSVNFLVTFILAMVTFSMGMFIIQKIMTSGGDQIYGSQLEVDERVATLSCNSEEALCIVGRETDIDSGDTTLYSLVIYHRGGSGSANLIVDIKPFKAYDASGTQRITGFDSTLNPPTSGKVRAFMVENTLTAEPNVRTNKGIMVVADKDAEAGQYYFTVEVSAVTLGSGGWNPKIGELIVNVG